MWLLVGLRCWLVRVAGWFASLVGLLYWLVGFAVYFLVFAGWFALFFGLRCWMVCVPDWFAFLVDLRCWLFCVVGRRRQGEVTGCVLKTRTHLRSSGEKKWKPLKNSVVGN